MFSFWWVRDRVGCLFGGGAVKNATERRRTLAREGKNWRLCWSGTVAQAGMPVLLKPVATIPFCGLIFFRVADHLLLEGVL